MFRKSDNDDGGKLGIMNKQAIVHEYKQTSSLNDR